MIWGIKERTDSLAEWKPGLVSKTRPDFLWLSFSYLTIAKSWQGNTFGSGNSCVLCLYVGILSAQPNWWQSFKLTGLQTIQFSCNYHLCINGNTLETLSSSFCLMVRIKGWNSLECKYSKSQSLSTRKVPIQAWFPKGVKN